jgi:hypothetical protein
VNDLFDLFVGSAGNEFGELLGGDVGDLRIGHCLLLSVKRLVG